MNKFQKYAWVICAAFLLIAGSAVAAEKSSAETKDAAPSVVERGWALRCPEEQKDKKKQCEVFQRLDMKDSSAARVAEFAVGFPDKKEPARGVVILPLGILLEQGVSMKIDDGKPFVFKTRYCTNAGCFSYVNLDKTLLGSLKKGKAVAFQFKSATGQDINLIMNLSGFEKSLKEIL